MKRCFTVLIFFTNLFGQLSTENFCFVTIAKSGSNLTAKAIRLLSGYDYCMSKYGSEGGEGCYQHDLCDRFFFTHFYPYANNDLHPKMNPLKNPQMKYIFNVRDLRDVFVSASHF